MGWALKEGTEQGKGVIRVGFRGPCGCWEGSGVWGRPGDQEEPVYCAFCQDGALEQEGRVGRVTRGEKAWPLWFRRRFLNRQIKNGGGEAIFPLGSEERVSPYFPGPRLLSRFKSLFHLGQVTPPPWASVSNSVNWVRRVPVTQFCREGK